MSVMSGAQVSCRGGCSERGPLLLWMIFTGLSIFAAVLLWRYGLIRLMVVSDRTYISSLIARSLHRHLRSLLLADPGDCA